MSKNEQSLDDENGGDDDEDEVPAHPFAATAEDSKKRKLDSAAASEDCNTMEWLCSKQQHPFYVLLVVHCFQHKHRLLIQLLTANTRPSQSNGIESMGRHTGEAKTLRCPP